MPESKATAEGRVNTGQAPEPTKDELAQVLDLMAGATADQDDLEDGDESPVETAAEREGEKPRGAPKNLDELGEALGVKVSDLYNLEVPIGGDAENVKTLGELKDIVKAGTELDLERIEFEESKTKRDTEYRKQAQDIADIVASLPRHMVTDELKEKIFRQRSQIQEREDALVRATIPEWSDGELRAKDWSRMTDYLSEFGFPATFLDNVYDHKVINLVRDAALRKSRLDQALENVRQVKNSGHGKSQNAPKPSRKPSRASRRPGGRNTTSAVNQVAALINDSLLKGK
jgi:hypothetical protein